MGFSFVLPGSGLHFDLAPPDAIELANILVIHG
jgi:hypothetical protein